MPHSATPGRRVPQRSWWFSKGNSHRTAALRAAVDSASLNMAVRDFSAIDRHALKAPRSSERSLESLATYLTAPARDDTERTRALFRWVAERIEYDAAAYFAGRIRRAARDPEDVLRTRRAVCDGFAGLFAALAGTAGLEAVVIPGHAKGDGYRPGATPSGPPNHAWNAVRLAGQWHLLDATWGAGAIDARRRVFAREFEPHYFLTPPAQAIFRHWPEDPRWQLLDKPLDAKQFGQLPLVSPTYFHHRLRLLNHDTAVVRSTGELAVQLAVPPQVRITAELCLRGREVAGGAVLVQQIDEAATVLVRAPRPERYELRIFSKDDPTQTRYRDAVTLRVDATRGVGGGAGFPEPYAAFGNAPGFLDGPLQRRLKAGVSRQFRVRIPGAESAAVAANGGMQELEPREPGWFEGSIRVPRGETLLCARFPGRHTYQGLLRYEGV